MNYFVHLPSLPSCLRLIDKWPPQMWHFFSFIFHAQKNMRPIWLQPPAPAPSSFRLYMRQSGQAEHTRVYSRDYSSLSLSLVCSSQAFLPSSCRGLLWSWATVLHPRGKWGMLGRVWLCWRESRGFKVCVLPQYCMLCSVKWLNAAFCPPTAAAVCVPPFLCLNLCCCGCLCPSPVRRPALRSTISSWAPIGPLCTFSFL